MNQGYEKVYFNDNYKAHFESLRNAFGERSRKALQERKIDHAPVPNATTIVFLHKDQNGGEHITTDDFVSYFNSRYGGSDRIGMMCRTLDYAERKAELKEKAAARQIKSASRSSRPKVSFCTRSAARRPVLANLAYALLVCLSVVMFFASSATVDRAALEVAQLEAEAAFLEAGTAPAVTLSESTISTAGVSYTALAGEDSTEIFEVEEEDGIGTVLLDAFGFLVNK